MLHTVFTAIILISVSLATSFTHAARTGTMGLAEGTPAAVDCSVNTYLAGFNVQYARSFSGLHPYCVNMAPDGAWLGSAQISQDRWMTNANPGGNRVDVFCPLDTYVFGFSGYSFAYGVHQIVQLKILCKNVKTGVSFAIETLNDSTSKTEWRGDQCKNEEVAKGVFGLHQNDTIIQFGLSCERTRPAILAAAKVNPNQAGPPVFVQLAAPRILAPLGGQRFLNQTPVPIKLTPPQGWSVSMYTVNLQRKQSNGQWAAHTTLPVGPLQAHSANGYAGWGTGGTDGRSLAFLSSPGAWRANAQINGPKQSAWSDWVEFGIMAPPTSTNALKPGVGFGKK